MAVSTTKSALLALTANTVDILHPAGCRDVASGQRFIHQPCPGVSVVLRVGWTFQGWTAFCQPWFSISSVLLRQTCKTVLGKLPQNEPLWHRYQSIRRKLGKYDLAPPHFYEDLARADRKPWQLLIRDTPICIKGLIDDCASMVVPSYNLRSEAGFLRSMPINCDYNVHDPARRAIEVNTSKIPRFSQIKPRRLDDRPDMAVQGNSARFVMRVWVRLVLRKAAQGQTIDERPVPRPYIPRDRPYLCQSGRRPAAG